MSKLSSVLKIYLTCPIDATDKSAKTNCHMKMHDYITLTLTLTLNGMIKIVWLQQHHVASL